MKNTSNKITSQRVLGFGGLLFSLVFSVACTQTLILFKPSPYIDPMPVDQNPVGQGADPMLDKQWSLAKVGLSKETFSDLKFQGNYNVKVAILSTGIDYNHEDLVGQIHVNRAEISHSAAGEKPGVNQKDEDGNGLVDDVVGYDVVDGDGFAYDRHGAGTAVAGIIAAKRNNGVGIAGLMGQVSLYPIRYINDNGQTSIGNLVSALEVAKKVKPDVIFIQNTQFRIGGYEMNPQVASAELSILTANLQELQKLKIPVVVGAGDELGTFGDNELEKMLRSFDNIVIVASTTSKDKKALLSNFSHQNVLTAAPGEEILTTKPLNKYGVVSGTAYAAAHVTAALALAKSAKGEKLSYDEVIPKLISKDGSDQLEDLMTMSRGGNRLQISKFLESL